MSFTLERMTKINNLRQADYKSGFDKLRNSKHSRKRLHQIKMREARHQGFIIKHLATF